MGSNKRVRQLLDEVGEVIEEAGLHWRIEFGGKHHKIVISNGVKELKTPYTISHRRERDVHRMKLADVRRIVRELTS